MAFAIAGPVFGKVVFNQKNQLQLADDAVPATHAPTNVITGTARALNDPCIWFFSEYYMKTFVSGTGTVSQIFRTEVAGNTGFTSGAEFLANVPLSRNALSEGYGIGKVPDGVGKGFARVVSDANGTDTGTADLLISAV